MAHLAHSTTTPALNQLQHVQPVRVPLRTTQQVVLTSSQLAEETTIQFHRLAIVTRSTSSSWSGNQASLDHHDSDTRMNAQPSSPTAFKKQIKKLLSKSQPGRNSNQVSTKSSVTGRATATTTKTASGAMSSVTSNKLLDMPSMGSIGARDLPRGSVSKRLSWIKGPRALVLDSQYQPINVIHWKRAVEWALFDKAEPLQYFPPEIYAVSGQGRHELPAVMRIKTNFSIQKTVTRVNCTRRNIMIRDKFTCQYCGSKKLLTLDHIVPVSKGGKDSWKNLVTACTPCNQKKSNHLLHTMKNMKLRSEPKEPTPWELGIVVGLSTSDLMHPPPEWEPWIEGHRARLKQVRSSCQEHGVEPDDLDDAVFEEEEADVVIQEVKAM